ncbi:MAG: M15 family metallopeptidase [Clostridia bacterium]|nr:M15 family metallopeptidase [Clostridia bacterium]
MKVGDAIFVLGKGDNGWNKVKIGDNIRFVWYENLSSKKPTTTKKPTAAPDKVSTSSKGYSIVTKNGITYVDGVLVVNKTYSLPSSYYIGGLTSECDKAYDKLKAAAAKAGNNIYISSGFRSYSTQEGLYNRYVSTYGKAEADRFSARPGYSEHQTGLAIDLNGVSDSFGATKEGKWVAAHCHEYGFILRYPKGKEAQTGYMYEPWHIRYVGVDVATKIYNSGLCLEEYYGITSQYS